MPLPSATSPPVIAGFNPAIHDTGRPGLTFANLSAAKLVKDARVKPAHDKMATC